MALIVTENVHHKVDDFDLGPDALTLLWRMEDRHFWHRARNRWILSALRGGAVHGAASILEVGCGSGAVARFLQEVGYRVTGIDTAEPLVQKAHERCAAATFVVGDVTSFTTPEPFAAIALFDVLEHLDEPESMLRACCRHAAPGTLFIATVPAQAALHTVIDDLSGHKRRYEKGELANLFARAGFVDIEERGIFRLTALFQKSLRKDVPKKGVSELSADEIQSLWRQNFRIPAAPINCGLEALCFLEKTIGSGLARNRPGASLLATGRFMGPQSRA